MSFRNLIVVGALTWLIIGVPSVAWELRTYHLTTPAGMTWAGCYIAFILCFWIGTCDWCLGMLELLMRIAQTILALICAALQPTAIQAVLLVIVAAQLGALSLGRALSWITAQSVALGAIFHWQRMDHPFSLTLAYFAFQLFGVITTRIAHEEGEARRALAAANAALQVATGLLHMSSRAEERLRIARDLHDLIGHHLTALTLNLEVASHLAEGAAKEHVEKSKSLAKLLLSDLRDVVGQLREEEPIDLTTALQSLHDAVPSPSIHLDVAAAAGVSDPAVARAALRAVQEIVTNAVRHSGARNLWLRIALNDSMLTVDAHDDGSGTDQIRFGNGLTGMRERVEELRGSVEVSSMRGHGFEVHVKLPLEGAAA